MANGQKHIIKKQVLNLELLTQQNNGHQLQAEISEVYKARVIPVLEEVLDSLAKQGESVRVEKLELDLGEIFLNKLNEEFPEKVELQLRKILGGQLIKKRNEQQNRILSDKRSFVREDDSGITIKDLPESKMEWLVYFLRNGQMPWNAGITAGKRSFPGLLRELVKEDPVNLWQALDIELQHQQQKKRFIYQCSDEVIFEVLNQWLNHKVSSQQTVDTIKLCNDLNNVLLRKKSIFNRLSKANIRQIIWEEVISIIKPEAGKAGVPEKKMKARVLQILEILVRKETGENHLSNRTILSYLKKLAATDPQFKSKHKVLKKRGLSFIVKELIKDTGKQYEQIENEEYSGAAAIEKDGKTVQSGKEPAVVKKVGKDRLPESKSLRDEMGSTGPDPEEKERKTAAGDKKQLADRIEKAKQQFEKNKEIEGQQARKPGTFQSGPETKQNGDQDGSGIKREGGSTPVGKKEKERLSIPFSTRQEIEEAYINNAGLVILHPFLPALFEGLGLVKNKAFISEEAAQRAVHLLQHLVTGQQETPEEELFLNKLICGIRPDEPVISGIEITEEEKEECEGLLDHIVKLWTVLKNSSPASVRQTFLSREGLVTKNGAGGWKVLIERNTFDILLDRLPWGISIIKFPWNNYLIYVEW